MVGAARTNTCMRYRSVMDTESGTLRETFVEAFPVYVASVLVARGIETDEVTADAIVEGALVLDGLLATLEETPPRMQRYSPLELFREALRPVGLALDTVGVRPPQSDPGSVTFVEWDTHMLSPASSAALGPRAHEAHLRWGVSKARAMGAFPSKTKRPTIAVQCSIEDRRIIEGQAVGAGYVVTDRMSDASFAVVDMDGIGSAGDVARALEAGCRTIVYGSRIDDIQQAAMWAQGVWRVISRDDALADIGAVLPSPA